MQLAEMGFPLEACRKAVYYTGNMGPEMAFNWIIAHMEEPGKNHSNWSIFANNEKKLEETSKRKGFKKATVVT